MDSSGIRVAFVSFKGTPSDFNGQLQFGRSGQRKERKNGTYLLLCHRKRAGWITAKCGGNIRGCQLPDEPQNCLGSWGSRRAGHWPAR